MNARGWHYIGDDLGLRRISVGTAVHNLRPGERDLVSDLADVLAGETCEYLWKHAEFQRLHPEDDAAAAA